MIRVLWKASENYLQLLSKAEWVHEENIKAEGKEGERGMLLRNENTDSHNIITAAPPRLTTTTLLLFRATLALRNIYLSSCQLLLLYYTCSCIQNSATLRRRILKVKTGK